MAAMLAARNVWGGKAMSWLVGGSEVALGIALFVGLSFLVAVLRPRGTLQERRIVSFPGAWIVVGLPLTAGFAVAIALVAVGLGILR
jgi:hypothetical protein